MEKGVFLLNHNLKAVNLRKRRKHHKLPCNSFSSCQGLFCPFLKSFQGKNRSEDEYTDWGMGNPDLVEVPLPMTEGLERDDL